MVLCNTHMQHVGRIWLLLVFLTYQVQKQNKNKKHSCESLWNTKQKLKENLPM